MNPGSSPLPLITPVTEPAMPNGLAQVLLHHLALADPGSYFDFLGKDLDTVRIAE